MKIYDIAQELFNCKIFPGDSRPEREVVRSMEAGDRYNLINVRMCVHNGTHIDAPSHFLRDGKTVEQVPLEKFVGMAYVATHAGRLTAADAKQILREAGAISPEAAKRILIKGDAILSEEAAQVFANAGIDLFGNESQTVGPEDAPMAVHLILLGREVVLLEGIRLQEVPEGVYLLNAATLCFAGAEGSPCRAILLDLNQ